MLPPSSCHGPRLAAAIAAGLAASIVAAAPAAGAEVALGERSVTLELEAADLTVTVGEPPARLVSTANDPASGDDHGLETIFEGGSVAIRRRPAPDGWQRPRARLEVAVWLAIDQRLSVLGTDLEITVTAPLEPAADEPLVPEAEDDEIKGEDPEEAGDGSGDDEDEAEADGSGRDGEPTSGEPLPPGLEIGVVASTVSLVHTADAALALVGSRLRAERTRGTLRVVAEDESEAELVGHRGALLVDATRSDAVVVETEGRIEALLDAANLLLQDGFAVVEARARGGLLAVERWRGSVTLNGDGTTVELRDTTPRAAVTGNALRVTAEQGRGTLQVTGEQGSDVRIEGWSGRTVVDLRGGARLDARELTAPLSLKLADGARGEVIGVESIADVTLENAELTLERVRNVKLNATDAIAAIADVGRLDRVEARGARLELDLTATRAFGRIAADRGSELVLAMREPCRVVVGGSAGRGSGEDIDANRCFVQLEGAPTPGRPYVPRERGRVNIVRVELESGGRLTVEGHAP